MIFHEFGCEHKKIIVLFHASCMTWDMYQRAIDILEKRVHVIIPALPGHDLSKNRDCFTSIEKIAEEVEMWLDARVLALRDFLMIELGRSNRKFIDSAFNPQKYPKEVLDTVYQVLRHFDAKTAWRIFDSCNNYSMPEGVLNLDAQVKYWYGKQEEKDRALDIQYIKNVFPNIEFRVINCMGHAEYSLLHQSEFATDLLKYI